MKGIIATEFQAIPMLHRLVMGPLAQGRIPTRTQPERSAASSGQCRVVCFPFALAGHWIQIVAGSGGARPGIWAAAIRWHGQLELQLQLGTQRWIYTTLVIEPWSPYLSLSFQAK